MILTLALLLGSALLIYLACEYFVNGVEWVGERFGVSQTAVGTVLWLRMRWGRRGSSRSSRSS